uniref:Putative secreted protein ovary overexpressed n=1 Tax=Rhipicephalus microplus TaxID=6941 RepID=A0A6M2DAG7_RHIMP
MGAAFVAVWIIRIFSTLLWCVEAPPFSQKKNDNRFLFFLACLHVLSMISSECYDMVILLLCSGDIESNPGPTLRSHNLETEPGDSGKVLELLQAMDARTTDLSTDNKAIKSSQIAMETKLANIFA